MTIVTLTTDFGHKDFSISVIKAALITTNSQFKDNRYFS